MAIRAAKSTVAVGSYIHHNTSQDIAVELQLHCEDPLVPIRSDNYAYYSHSKCSRGCCILGDTIQPHGGRPPPCSRLPSPFSGQKRPRAPPPTRSWCRAPPARAQRQSGPPSSRAPVTFVANPRLVGWSAGLGAFAPRPDRMVGFGDRPSCECSRPDRMADRWFASVGNYLY